MFCGEIGIEIFTRCGKLGPFANNKKEPSVSQHRTVEIAPGIELPLVGFGTYLIPNEDASVAVHQAVASGYRHVDTAEAYGNEVGVGDGIRKATADLGLDRASMFVTTKLWPGNPAWGDPVKGREAVIGALENSLNKLGMEYVDLYLIHAPFAAERRVEQWNALLELKERGMTRAIGVSNFNMDHILELESAGLPLPDANQIELHPWSQKPELVAFLKEKEILPIAYSSLLPLSTWRNKEGQDSGKTEEMLQAGLRQDSPFRHMAARYGVTEAQVLLRWAVQKGYPVLPKSTNAERVKLNHDLFSFEISAEDMEAIARMDRGEGVAWSVGDPTKIS